MTRNSVIIFICIFIIIWNFYLKKSELLSAYPLKIVARILLAYCVIGIMLPNLALMGEPFVPETKGRVIDSVTGQPIPKCNVKVFWMIESPGLGGAHSEAYHDYQTITNENGEYTIPRYPKALTMYGPLFPLMLYSGYGFRHTFFYSHGYKYADSYHHKEDISNVKSNIFPLVKLNSPIEYLKNMFELKLSVLTYGYYPSPPVSDYDKKYFADDYNLFKTKYQIPDRPAKDIEGELLSISGIMERIGRYDLAIEILQKVRKMDVTETRVIDFMIQEKTDRQNKSKKMLR